MIKAEHIDKIYPVPSGGEFYALRDVNVDIPRGKLTILKGRSGSGKTTLLNIISALDESSNGVVHFDEDNLTQMTEKEKEQLRRYQIGFIFQAVALIPIMTAYENVDYALRLAGYKGDRKKRAEECLKKVGLAERMHHLPAQLSGGEQQRVAIARAIAHQPKVIFADEPTAALDTMTALRVVKIFKDLIAQEECTIVMTTHSADLMEAADVLYELSDGRVIQKVVSEVDKSDQPSA